MLNLRLEIRCLVTAALVLSSCSTVIEPANARVVAEHFAFLREGYTTRQEVIDHLGDPLNQYEQGGTVSYLLVEHSDGQFEVVRGLVVAKPPIYNLVLSFGPDDTLTRFSLLHIE
jgi:hypothetical protein